MEQMKLQELNSKSPTDLVTFAEGLEVENASTMRKQELMFAILKSLAEQDVEIIGEGVVEVLQDVSVNAAAVQRAIVRMYFFMVLFLAQKGLLS